jgi:raffinose/stachyose/melibiose transport system permease protein
MSAVAVGKKSGRVKRPKGLALFAIPALLVYGVFFLLPAIQTLYYSFFNWEGPGTSAAFVDIENYKTKLFDDTTFHKSIGVTLKFMLIVVVFQTLISLAYSVRLVRNTKPTIFLRALYFFPTILSSTAVGFIWNFVYEPSGGFIVGFLRAIGTDYRPAILASPNTALYFLAIVQVWFHVGQMMVIFVAGLQGIPKDYMEAAAIDGATKGQTFRKVTWPLLGSATSIVVAYTTLQSFRAFDLVFVMTQGGPDNSTRVLGYHIVATAREAAQYGEAATESVMFMALIALVTFLQRRGLKLLKADSSGGAG